MWVTVSFNVRFKLHRGLVCITCILVSCIKNNFIVVQIPQVWISVLTERSLWLLWAVQNGKWHPWCTMNKLLLSQLSVVRHVNKERGSILFCIDLFALFVCLLNKGIFDGRLNTNKFSYYYTLNPLTLFWLAESIQWIFEISAHDFMGAYHLSE